MSTMYSTSYPKARADIEAHLLPDGTCLLVDLAADEGHVLSVLGALVWDYCDGTMSREDITAEVAALLPQDPAVRDEVMQFLDTFVERGLLQGTEASADQQSPRLQHLPE
jgi:hypothetical protein